MTPTRRLWLILAWSAILVLTAADLALGSDVNVTGTLAIAPFLAAMAASRRETAAVGVAAVAAGAGLYLVDDVPAGAASVRLGTVAAASALAAWAAGVRATREARLIDVTAVARAAHLAILAPTRERVGPVALATRYISAAREASVGGDVYEVVPWRDGVRLMVGDARGKGLEAVRLATVVLGSFREAADELPDLAAVARVIDRRLRRHLTDEDFVTACLVEITGAGRLTVVCCGHPCPLLLSKEQVNEVGCGTYTLPLGLGADPIPTVLDMNPGDRLLMFTDGLIEARTQSGAFVELPRLIGQLAGHTPEDAADELVQRLWQAVGSRLDDDLALLVADYRP